MKIFREIVFHRFSKTFCANSLTNLEMIFPWNQQSREVIIMKKKANVCTLVERSIKPASNKRAPCEWRFNDRGLPRWFAYHVCTFVTRHNVLLLIRAIECERPLSVQRIQLQGQGITNLYVRQLFAQASLSRHASSVIERLLRSNMFTNIYFVSLSI